MLKTRTPFAPPILGVALVVATLAATIAVGMKFSHRDEIGIATATARTPLVLVGGKATPIATADYVSTPGGILAGTTTATSAGVSMCSTAVAGCGLTDPGKWKFDPTNGEVAQTYTPGGASNDAYTIVNEGVGSTAIESGGFQSFINTTFDVTAHGAQSIGFLASAHATKSAGANALNNYGVISNATGGDINYSFFSQNGTLRNDGDVDFGGGGAVTLGNKVSSFNLPGSSSQVAEIGVGLVPTTDGSAIKTKNTNTTSAFSAVYVGLDTDVNAAIRGGFLIARGSGGNYGGNNSGLVVSSGANFPFVDSAANEVSVFSEFNQDLVFGADGSGFTSGYSLTRYNHLATRASLGAPTLDAGCTNGGSSSIVGNDIAFKVLTGAGSTACTVSFKHTYTSAPICTVTPEAGATHTETISATQVVFSANQSAKTYNVICIGQVGST